MSTTQTDVTRFDGVRVPASDYRPVWLESLADDVTRAPTTTPFRQHVVANGVRSGRVKLFGASCAKYLQRGINCPRSSVDRAAVLRTDSAPNRIWRL